MREVVGSKPTSSIFLGLRVLKYEPCVRVIFTRGASRRDYVPCVRFRFLCPAPIARDSPASRRPRRARGFVPAHGVARAPRVAVDRSIDRGSSLASFRGVSRAVASDRRRETALMRPLLARTASGVTSSSARASARRRERASAARASGVGTLGGACARSARDGGRADGRVGAGGAGAVASRTRISRARDGTGRARAVGVSDGEAAGVGAEDRDRDEDSDEIWGGQRHASETRDAPRRKARTKAEREASAESYEWSAWASSCGVTSIAITATYFRILREVDVNGGVFPWAELVAQLALIAGAAVGMEFYARYAHKHLWHGSWWSMSSKYRREWNKPIWLLHESHHLPREGAFEANDVFALVNGVPAFALCAFGFFNPGVFGGLCFGAGLGITLYGIAYMYVHDGLVHKRFPTGPLGKLPLMRRIAAGHTIHHTEAFEGVPWGLFLGIQELEAVPGGLDELEKVVAAAERKEKREELELQRRASVGLVTQGAHIPSEREAPQCKLPDLQ